MAYEVLLVLQMEEANVAARFFFRRQSQKEIKCSSVIGHSTTTLERLQRMISLEMQPNSYVTFLCQSHGIMLCCIPPKHEANPFSLLWVLHSPCQNLVFTSFSFLKAVFQVYLPFVLMQRYTLKLWLTTSGNAHSSFTRAPLWIPLEYRNIPLLSVMWSFSKLVKMQRTETQNW